MPMFYFNVHNDDVTMDYEGADLADLHAARAYAVVAARSLAADTVSRGHIGLSDWIDIEDAGHQSVGRVTYADAVEVRP